MLLQREILAFSPGQYFQDNLSKLTPFFFKFRKLRIALQFFATNLPSFNPPQPFSRITCESIIISPGQKRGPGHKQDRKEFARHFKTPIKHDHPDHNLKHLNTNKKTETQTTLPLNSSPDALMETETEAQTEPPLPRLSISDGSKKTKTKTEIQAALPLLSLSLKLKNPGTPEKRKTPAITLPYMPQDSEALL